MPPPVLADLLGKGLLSFPVTHFAADLSFDERAYRENTGWLAEHGAAGLFAAGGTGEFFSLTLDEVERVVAAAVQETPDGLPVVAPAGYSSATAAEMARRAEQVGADGVLLFPPYLTECGPDGLERYVCEVCEATELGVILYNRANARYSDHVVARLADACPNFVGFKDGVGDIEQMSRIYARLGDRLMYIGGLPTAEMFALPYLSLGLTTYSSAIFNFLPKYALDFYAAVRRRDDASVFDALESFFIPYCELRGRFPGYAVSIIKAGMKVIGRAAGPVRPPLTDLDGTELAELRNLVSRLA
ncbi:5-dehydro-4-deoxyglucarate dehydratase [Phytoactinopolyspora limicola]|uniref:5-dehydro-4-deoxyglucarate dehydratase n=1 Tax=Phytoactinopolyspora limicola TaxID=2715536 RepID=UPI00140DEC63|nr:5-dehydro-4-deoxyglucarate dehydratase [Phytoactinopolyspora limicola]